MHRLVLRPSLPSHTASTSFPNVTLVTRLNLWLTSLSWILPFELPADVRDSSGDLLQSFAIDPGKPSKLYSLQTPNSAHLTQEANSFVNSTRHSYSKTNQQQERKLINGIIIAENQLHGASPAQKRKKIHCVMQSLGGRWGKARRAACTLLAAHISHLTICLDRRGPVSTSHYQKDGMFQSSGKQKGLISCSTAEIRSCYSVF